MNNVVNSAGNLLFLLGMALVMAFMLMSFTDFLKRTLRKGKRWEK